MNQASTDPYSVPLDKIDVSDAETSRARGAIRAG